MNQYLKMAGITMAAMLVLNQAGAMNSTIKDWLGPVTVGDALGGLLDSLMFWKK